MGLPQEHTTVPIERPVRRCRVTCEISGRWLDFDLESALAPDGAEYINCNLVDAKEGVLMPLAFDKRDLVHAMSQVRPMQI